MIPEYCLTEWRQQVPWVEVTRALFEKNLHEKVRFDDFRHDILDLLADSNEWSFEQAYDVVKDKLICLLPGEPWKIK